MRAAASPTQPERPSGTQRTSAVLWRLPPLSSLGGVPLGVAALVVCAIIWLHAAGPGAYAGEDFHAYLSGARQIAAGINPYHDLSAQAASAGTTSGGFNAHGYVYPPLLAAVLALPVRLDLDARTLWILWNLLTLAGLLWMGYILSATLRGKRGWRRDWSGALAFLAAILLFALSTYDLWLGQADLLMAALVVGACDLWLRRNPWAGLVLGLAIAVKPTMALVLLVWLWHGDWRAVLRGALAAGALLVLPFALIGWGALHDYLVFLVHWNAFHADAEYINQSPSGMLLRLFTANPYTTPLAVLPWLVTPLRLGVILGAALWWMRAVPRALTSDRARAMAECLLALPLILLVSPLSEDIHYCVLLPVLVGLSWLAWSRRRLSSPAAWVLWLALLLCWVPRMQELIYPGRFFPLPLQGDPHLGPVIALARTGTLLALALATLLAGGATLRGTSTAPMTASAPPAQEPASAATHLSRAIGTRAGNESRSLRATQAP
jgi:hypothetical protein